MKRVYRLVTLAVTGLLAVVLAGASATGAAAAPAHATAAKATAATSAVRPMTSQITYSKYFSPGTSIGTRKALLIFQTDGNLVVYDENGAARWASNTRDIGAYAVFQTDGNFVVYSRTNTALWWSGTCCYLPYHTFLAVQDDGNVVIYRADWAPLWATWTQH